MEGCEAGRSVSQFIKEDEPVIKKQPALKASAARGMAQEKEDCEVGVRVQVSESKK